MTGVNRPITRRCLGTDFSRLLPYASATARLKSVLQTPSPNHSSLFNHALIKLRLCKLLHKIIPAGSPYRQSDRLSSAHFTLFHQSLLTLPANHAQDLGAPASVPACEPCLFHHGSLAKAWHAGMRAPQRNTAHNHQIESEYADRRFTVLPSSARRYNPEAARPWIINEVPVIGQRGAHKENGSA